MKAILIKTDQSGSIFEADDILDIYNYYGGFIETVYPNRLEKPFCMIVDDDGLRKGLPTNTFGSFLYETEKHGNRIAGDIFIMKQVWVSDGYDLKGLSDEEIVHISETYALEKWRGK